MAAWISRQWMIVRVPQMGRVAAITNDATRAATPVHPIPTGQSEVSRVPSIRRKNRTQSRPSTSWRSSVASRRVIPDRLKTLRRQTPQKRTRSSPDMESHETGQGFAT